MEDAKQVKVRTGLLSVLFLAAVSFFVYMLYYTQIVKGDSYRERTAYSQLRTETVDTSRGEILDTYGRVLVSNTTQYQVTLDASLMGQDRERILVDLLAICREEGVEWTDTLCISKTIPYTYTTLDGERGAVIWLRKLCEFYKLDQGPIVVTLEEPEPSPEPEEAPPEEGENAEVSPEQEETPAADPAAEATGADGLPTQSAPPEEEDTEPREVHTWAPALSAGDLLDKLAEKMKITTEGLSRREIRDLIGMLYELTIRENQITYAEYTFATDVGIRFITLVKEHQLNGVIITPVGKRQYHTTYAAHILGRVGPIQREQWLGDEENGIEGYKDKEGYRMNSIIGQDGAERAFESWLHGVSGTREIETDSTGKQTRSGWREGQEAQPGGNVVLTIDERLQAAVEDRLAAHIATVENPGNGAAVVVDMTGGVLAMASYPTYDLSQFSDAEYYNSLLEDPLRPMNNYATTGLYAPGSIYKPCVAIGALQEGIITPRDWILDTGYYTYFTKNPLWAPKCWIYRTTGGTHGRETVSDAIRDSCNVFFYDVGRRLGIEKLQEYTYKFGLGRATGIEVYEEIGTVAGPETSERLGTEWVTAAITSAAIGQENNQFTPLQLANYIATLVNGGTHYPAHLLKSVKSSDYSQVLYEYEPQAADQIEIDPENLAAVKLGMYQVTQSAAAKHYFDALPVKAGAKTGTAEVGQSTNATFVCFAPYDDPQIAMCLVVQDDDAGANLASLAADILQFYFTTEGAVSAPVTENQLMR